MSGIRKRLNLSEKYNIILLREKDKLSVRQIAAKCDVEKTQNLTEFLNTNDTKALKMTSNLEMIFDSSQVQKPKTQKNITDYFKF